MHPMDIITALHKSGNPPAKVARDLSISPSAVSQIIHNKKRSRRVAVYISGITGLSLNALWDNTYDDSFDHQVRAA